MLVFTCFINQTLITSVIGLIIGSLVTAGKVGNSLVTAGGRPGYGWKQCLGIVVKLPCSVAVTDRGGAPIGAGGS